MASSQNGWAVVPDSQRDDKITDPTLFGVDFPNGWLKGDVDTVFRHLIGRLHREVEPITDGACWGYFVKKIEGSESISNHASGTAIDYNAERHPMGSRNTYSVGDRAKIRAILADLDGVVRWGGDYSGRPDDMHFEINSYPLAVARVARGIREGEDMTKAEMLEVLNSDAGQAAIRKAVAKTKTGNEAYPGRTIEDMAGDLHAFLDDWIGDGKGAAVRPTKPGSLGERLRELAVADVPAAVAEILALLKAPPTP